MELAGTIISLLVVVFAAFMKWYTGRDKTYANLQTGREDIVSGNVDAVNARIDELLSVSTKPTSGGTSGVPNAEDVERRISQL